MMVADFKNNEIDSIKELIKLLAKRGYVLRSELERILCGCRYNTLELGDLKRIMGECISQSVLYVEDYGSIKSIQDCLEVQIIIKKMNFEDLYEYLEIERDATDKDFLIAVKKKKIMN